MREMWFMHRRAPLRSSSALWLMVGMVLTLTFAPGDARAQDRIEYKKKTVIDLTGATIEGELTRPEGTYIVNRKLSTFSTLIRARGSFWEELKVSHNEL